MPLQKRHRPNGSHILYSSSIYRQSLAVGVADFDTRQLESIKPRTLSIAEMSSFLHFQQKRFSIKNMRKQWRCPGSATIKDRSPPAAPRERVVNRETTKRTHKQTASASTQVRSRIIMLNSVSSHCARGKLSIARKPEVHPIIFS